MSSFTNVPMLIQQMQQEIRQKRYTLALDTIRELEKLNVSRKQILWHKALLESKVGNLHVALAYLKELDSDDLHAIKLQQTIVDNWDTYTQIIAEYNDAISEIQLGFGENALQIIDHAMELAGKLPIPIELYRMKTVLLARYESGTLSRYTAGLPMYVLDDPTIKRVVAAEPPRPDIARPVPKPKVKRKLKKEAAVLLASIATVLLVFFIWLIANLMSQPEVATESKAIAPVKKPAITETEPKKDEPVQEVVVKPEEPTELEFVSNEAANMYYNEGYRQFVKEDFPAAVVYFEYAMRTEDTDYFTDDASYFLASSYLREKKYEDVVEIAKAFRKEKDENYKESPYRDGIRLQESRALWKLGEDTQAVSILDELINKPDEDWVTYEARAMKKLVVDGESGSEVDEEAS
ncbi:MULTISPECIES: tol-pal system YbgF family protein [unclassified Sporosarcina]|uniref:tetratricopeptide repeat protein n=1 Tax=unclassified Sporosarcina TaxID=2647733 RepID=UPI000C167C31|nr:MULTISPECIES: hypothetical protein [unclassified Sporosarcina]PID05840.1 hypothetical protein CSV66_07560 [Sporosarcina sp. P30]PID09034.1 hypothetical protein CSV65_07560 [Sporosarcina sp. P31]PID12331.1 hypothetical protein CSV64_07030 [Sporosarcina sp. P32b]